MTLWLVWWAVIRFLWRDVSSVSRKNPSKDETRGLFGDVLVSGHEQVWFVCSILQFCMVRDFLVKGHLLRVCNQLWFSFKNSNGLTAFYARVTHAFLCGAAQTAARAAQRPKAQSQSAKKTPWKPERKFSKMKSTESRTKSQTTM